MARRKKDAEKLVDKIDWVSVGNRIRSLIKLFGVSQPQVAEDIGLDFRSLNNVILGSAQPSLNTILSIAEYFNVSIDYLLCRSDVPFINLFDDAGQVKNLDEDSIFLARQFQLLSEKEKDAIRVIVGSLIGGLDNSPLLSEGNKDEKVDG
ncbi:helix-turn-helix domain-containing protein [Carboxydothermus ferrireducens]|uniref:Transcriptional regulator with XRE-family HTH domain n=1 Tax=Carboxydothermus ferrireducens DSM 11255 TaxID=1119529 RepID=A0ABX2R7R4_9THEO|nr:helix-turn-helix transcriptional regulator [Carboxydothermus ferrireducens]NYE57214.1 transcriptional regulator with XRE-family HTH domain [Carboxydothermus ferrireducens DSM 11255]